MKESVSISLTHSDWPPKISFGGQLTLFLNGSFVELLPLSTVEVACSVTYSGLHLNE